MKPFHVPCIIGIILLLPQLVTGHELHLKNGTIIQTDSIIRDGGRLSYQKFGGMITIDLSEVEKIQYDRAPVSGGGSTHSDADAADRQISDEDDLSASLFASLAPTSPVEEANLSVVTIVTEAGYGSGFFISGDGLIVTNRHVVRGSQAADAQRKVKMQETADKLEHMQTSLAREKKQIDAYRRKLESSREQFHAALADKSRRFDPQEQQAVASALAERGHYLKQWLADYTERSQAYQAAHSEFTSKKRDYAQTSRRLSDQTRFTVILADGTEKSAVFYRTSDRYDLALLKIDGYRTPYLTGGDAAAVSLGQNVYAIGSPLKLNNTVTSGVVSNSRGDYIQTNAEIYPGNSGGPLVTEDGRVIGVNTMKRITEKFEGLGFAIKFSRVEEAFGDYLR